MHRERQVKPGAPVPRAPQGRRRNVRSHRGLAESRDREKSAEDPFGERQAWGQGKGGRPASPVQAIVDVPFSHGTLAANSRLMA